MLRNIIECESCLTLGDDVPTAGDGLDGPLLHRRRPLEPVRVHPTQKLVLQPHRVEILHYLSDHHRHQSSSTSINISIVIVNIVITIRVSTSQHHHHDQHFATTTLVRSAACPSAHRVEILPHLSHPSPSSSYHRRHHHNHRRHHIISTNESIIIIIIIIIIITIIIIIITIIIAIIIIIIINIIIITITILSYPNDDHD